MSEFIIYPNASVDADGNTTVTPEVIYSLVSEMALKEDYSEGDFALTVRYADLKTLIEMAGHSVKEITLEKPSGD